MGVGWWVDCRCLGRRVKLWDNEAMKRLVFLDVDGTLITHSQQVPDSAVAAVKRAQDKGHTLVLCTGRSLPEIYPVLWDMGFVGIVAGNGAYVRVGEKVLVDARLSNDDIRSISAVLDDMGAEYIWQGPETMAPSCRFADAFLSLAGEFGQDWEAYLDSVTTTMVGELPTSASKCTFVLPAGSGYSVADVRARIDGGYTIVDGSIAGPGGVTGELADARVSKGTGLMTVAAHLGVDLRDTVAVGDSANDVPMLETAGLAIAMGNATPVARAAADWGSSPIGEDGLARAFAHAGLV